MSDTSCGHTNDDPKSIRELIEFRAKKTPDDIFLIDPETGVNITFKELERHTNSICARIEKQNLMPGDSVAYAMSNDVKTALVILAIMSGGYVATAINLVAGPDIISYVLEHSQVKLILSNEKAYDLVQSITERSNIEVPLLTPDDGFFNNHNSISPKDYVKSNSNGLLMYTSGTTGRPKGVLLTHANLIAGGQNTALAHQLSNRDRGICVLPLYHINGLCVTLMGTLVSGGSLVIPQKFSVTHFWSTIIEHNCSWFSVVPTQISYLLHSPADIPSKDELKNVRFGRSASAPLSPEVQKLFEQKFSTPIIETMGLTETSAQILSNPLPPAIRKIGSPGIAYGNEIKIADHNQEEVARNIEGELLVRGPNVMSCYLKNEDATRQTITEDGWLRTGDLARMDHDGYLYITGRLKELIIKGGENIAPREIDEALYTHPDIIEAAAFGSQCDHYGERVEAAVTLKKGSVTSEEDLKQLCSSRLGHFKMPDRIHFLPELPKGPSGKIQRRLLISMLKN